MRNFAEMKNRFLVGFNEQQSELLAEFVVETYDDLVTRRDFAELREVVADLAASEKRLAIAQERTEARVEELAVAQKETQAELQKLAASHDKLAASHDRLAASHEQTQSDVHELTRISKEVLWSIASPPISRTAPRSAGLTSRLARPRSITTRGTATSGRPSRSRSTTSRYSMLPSHCQVAARLVTRPSMPEKIASSGRSRRSVSTTTAGASQTSAPSTTSAASEKTARRRRGLGCHASCGSQSSSDRERRLAIRPGV